MTTTPQTNSTLEQIAEVIRTHDDFVICGHVSPDGDCLGCQLTLYHALMQLGKRATCVLAQDEPISQALAFMPGVQSMIPARDFNGRANVFIGVDVPVRQRIGDAASILDECEVSITIDHHASETTMCQYVHVDPDSASASMLVWQVVKHLLDKPPIESAICAYTGLVTDTGGFRFMNSDERAFKAAAELVAYGVDPALIATEVFQNRTLPSLKLESLIVERMRVFHEGEAVLSWVTKADMDEVGAVKADVEPLIDVVRSLRGVRVAGILREQNDLIRGSLRSKDDSDVSSVARQLGGGGHKAAAGLTIDSTIEEALAVVQGKIDELLDSPEGRLA